MDRYSILSAKAGAPYRIMIGPRVVAVCQDGEQASRAGAMINCANAGEEVQRMVQALIACRRVLGARGKLGVPAYMGDDAPAIGDLIAKALGES